MEQDGAATLLVADGLTLSLVLLSAFLHASWNALTKSAGDPLSHLAIVVGTGGLIMVPVVVRAPVPHAGAWGWLLASAVVHFAYHLALLRAYRLGDLSQVYPIARGLAPLGVATLAALGAGEALGLGQLVGLAMASLAIMVLAGVRAPVEVSRRAVPVAVLTATLIGLYTYLDGRGVRSVPDPMSYMGWLFVLNAVPIVATAAWLRRRGLLAVLRREGVRAATGGAMATLGYVIVMWALSRAPMAAVASLRESSVLFAAVLGTRLLGEPLGRRRVSAALALVVGLVLVQLRDGLG